MRSLRALTGALVTLYLLGACATMAPISPAVRSDFAPTGKMRVGINHGNLVLAQKNAATGEVKGVAVDLARELGRRLDVPVELVQYGSAGQMTDALVHAALDVVTRGNAAVLGLDRYGVAVGDRADLVVLPGETLGELVAMRPPRVCVISGGRVIARDGRCVL